MQRLRLRQQAGQYQYVQLPKKANTSWLHGPRICNPGFRAETFRCVHALGEEAAIAFDVALGYARGKKLSVAGVSSRARPGAEELPCQESFFWKSAARAVGCAWQPVLAAYCGLQGVSTATGTRSWSRRARAAVAPPVRSCVPTWPYACFAASRQRRARHEG